MLRTSKRVSGEGIRSNEAGKTNGKEKRISRGGRQAVRENRQTGRLLRKNLTRRIEEQDRVSKQGKKRGELRKQKTYPEGMV